MTKTMLLIVASLIVLFGLMLMLPATIPVFVGKALSDFAGSGSVQTRGNNSALYP